MNEQRAFTVGLIVALVISFFLGYGILRGCEYLITNYSVQVKSK
jgi:hypothetical protein